MSISDHATEFVGKRIVNFAVGQPLDVENTVVRLAIDYGEGPPMLEQISALLRETNADRLTGLVIGMWDEEMFENQPNQLINSLTAAAPQLPSLRGIFLGDITYEECEISWIQQTDISPLFNAYPNLEEFRVRGGEGLSLGSMEFDYLRTLVIESGGLDKKVVGQVANARLPALEHLELYLGDSEYGWNGSVNDVAPFLSGELFPKLQYLGLRDSEIADEIAVAVAKSPLLSRIKILDLSRGTLGDDGARALMSAPAIATLEKLILRHHFCSSEMMDQLRGLPIDVDVSDQQSEEEYGRYVEVGE